MQGGTDAPYRQWPGAPAGVAQNCWAVVASAPVAVMLAASRGDAVTF